MTSFPETIVCLKKHLDSWDAESSIINKACVVSPLEDQASSEASFGLWRLPMRGIDQSLSLLFESFLRTLCDLESLFLNWPPTSLISNDSRSGGLEKISNVKAISQNADM